MKRRLLSVLTPLIFLLFIGAGCFSSEPSASDQTQKQAQTGQTLIRKAPTAKSPLEYAYEVCEASGFHVSVQFLSELGTSKSYCVFPNGKACDIFNFSQKTCTTESGAIPYTTSLPSLLESIRTCGADDPPVCGTDGKTYSNHCTSDILQVPVAHQGICPSPLASGSPPPTAEDDSSALPLKESPVPSKNIPSPSVSNTTGDVAGWLNIIIDLAESQSPKSPRAFIEKCTVEGSSMYFQSDGCANCFNVLYSNAGDVLCYPNNDTMNACPSSFQVNKRSPYCKLVWKDTR